MSQSTTCEDFAIHAIGIIGAGVIVEHGHLPAYAAHDLPVRAIFDLDAERAQRVAAAYPGVEVATSTDALLADDRITVVDIAVDPASQLALAEAAARSGRHVLCQKPLARTLDEAAALAARCRDLPGVRAVNQQMRWEPITAEVKRRLDAGDIGEPVSASIHTNLNADFPAGHWLAQEPRLMTLYGTIHFLDSARYLFGEPARITAKLHRDPAQVAAGEMWINAWVEWDSGLLLTIFERYTNWAGDQIATMRVEGSNGTVRGRFGIWDDYPKPSAGSRRVQAPRRVRVGALRLRRDVAARRVRVPDARPARRRGERRAGTNELGRQPAHAGPRRGDLRVGLHPHHRRARRADRWLSASPSSSSSSEGSLPDYRRRHDAIWPEMSALLDEAGISDFSIFVWQERYVFATLKASPDFAAANLVLRASPVQAEWERFMADTIAWQLDENDNLALLEEVFRHDGA